MSLKSQILLAPAVTIILIMGLIGFTLAKLTDIKQQNETVREWVRICSHAQGAISASQRMHSIAAKMRGKSNLDSDDDLHFNYLEYSRALSDHLAYPELRSRLSSETRNFLEQRQNVVRYRDDLNPVAVQSALNDMLPRLEKLYQGFWVQKRAAYTDYYDNVNQITSRLAMISLSVLAISVFTGIALSAWTIRHTKGRLGALARDARNICAGNLVSPPAPTQVRDEVDELASCMSTMTQRLLNVVASEKVLEGAEEERKRIAMDMHDQTLADLTNLSRQLQAIRSNAPSAGTEADQRLEQIEHDLEEVANNLREIIDDLHPQSLDLLGLDKAIRGYVEKRLTGPNLPSHFIHIDSDVDSALTEFERLNLYRIILEAISNIVRHAQASRYEIECRRQGGEITVLVEDNGRGFDLEAARRADGRGLSNIEERAKAIGASLTWGRSRFSSGTRMQLILPRPPSV